MGVLTRVVRDFEVTSPVAPPATWSFAELSRCLRSSLVPTTLTTALALLIIVAVRIPFSWLVERSGLGNQSSSDIVGAEVVATMVVEALSIVAFARVARALAVYPSVIAMERSSGLAALRRSIALTRPCREVSAR